MGLYGEMVQIENSNASLRRVVSKRGIYRLWGVGTLTVSSLLFFFFLSYRPWIKTISESDEFWGKAILWTMALVCVLYFILGIAFLSLKKEILHTPGKKTTRRVWVFGFPVFTKELSHQELDRLEIAPTRVIYRPDRPDPIQTGHWTLTAYTKTGDRFYLDRSPNRESLEVLETLFSRI